MHIMIVLFNFIRYLAPPRQVGGVTRGMRSAGTLLPGPAAGAPPAGPGGRSPIGYNSR
jgi:hypothetical protein